MIDSKIQNRKKLIGASVIAVLIASMVCLIIGILCFPYSFMDIFYADMFFGCFLLVSEVIFFLVALVKSKYKFLLESSAIIFLIFSLCILGLKIFHRGFYGTFDLLRTLLLVVFAVMFLVEVIRWKYNKKIIKTVMLILGVFIFLFTVFAIIYTVNKCCICLEEGLGFGFWVFILVELFSEILYVVALLLFYELYPKQNFFMRKNSYLAKKEVDIEYALEILKEKYESGKISLEEYNRAKSEIINKM
ncbi:MAG: hypothetical protein ACI4XI_10045 [Ruminococcus sp.]